MRQTTGIRYREMDMRNRLHYRTLTLFGHVRRRLPEDTPAHDVLHASVKSHDGMVPHPGWRRKPGRPRCTWLHDVLKATRLTAREAWTAADYGGGVGSATVHRRLRVLMMMKFTESVEKFQFSAPSTFLTHGAAVDR